MIGLGVGEAHIEGYLRHPHCEVLGICDLDATRLTSVGDAFSIPFRTTRAEALIDHPEIDVVSICSYDNVHAQQAIRALRSGKHVMVEKPVCLSMEEAEAVLSAAQDSGRYLTSSLILRASPRFRHVKQLTEQKALGDLFYVEGDYLHGILHKITEGWRGKMDFYCVTYGGGIHLIDLLRWLVADEVAEVFSYGNQICSRDSAYRYPDCIVSILRFRNGCIGKTMTSLGCVRPQLHSLNLYGTRGSLFNGYETADWFESTHREEVKKITAPYPGVMKGDLIPEFLDAILAGRKPPINEIEIFRTMSVCFAAWESCRSGKPVKVHYII